MAQLINPAYTIFAGEENRRAQNEAIERLMASGLSLPQAQERDHSGVIGIHLVRSIYGWSVRYASGLQGFGILRSSSHRSGHIGPREHDVELADFNEARDYAAEWATNYKGYAYVSTDLLKRYGIEDAI